MPPDPPSLSKLDHHKVNPPLPPHTKVSSYAPVMDQPCSIYLAEDSNEGDGIKMCGLVCSMAVLLSADRGCSWFNVGICIKRLFCVVIH